MSASHSDNKTKTSSVSASATTESANGLELRRNIPPVLIPEQNVAAPAPISRASIPLHSPLQQARRGSVNGPHAAASPSQSGASASPVSSASPALCSPGSASPMIHSSSLGEIHGDMGFILFQHRGDLAPIVREILLQESKNKIKATEGSTPVSASFNPGALIDMPSNTYIQSLHQRFPKWHAARPNSTEFRSLFATMDEVNSFGEPSLNINDLIVEGIQAHLSAGRRTLFLLGDYNAGRTGEGTCFVPVLIEKLKASVLRNAEGHPLRVIFDLGRDQMILTDPETPNTETVFIRAYLDGAAGSPLVLSSANYKSMDAPEAKQYYSYSLRPTNRSLPPPQIFLLALRNHLNIGPPKAIDRSISAPPPEHTAPPILFPKPLSYPGAGANAAGASRSAASSTARSSDSAAACASATDLTSKVPRFLALSSTYKSGASTNEPAPLTTLGPQQSTPNSSLSSTAQPCLASSPSLLFTPSPTRSPVAHGPSASAPPPGLSSLAETDNSNGSNEIITLGVFQPHPLLRSNNSPFSPVRESSPEQPIDGKSKTPSPR